MYLCGKVIKLKKASCKIAIDKYMLICLYRSEKSLKEHSRNCHSDGFPLRVSKV